MRTPSPSFSQPTTSSSPLNSGDGSSRPKKIAFILLTTLLGLGAAGAGAVVAAGASAHLADDGHILPGVRIAEIPVGGLTPDEAREKVRSWARTQSGKPLTLRAPVSGRTWNIPLADAGVRFNVDDAVTQARAVGQEETFWERIVLANRDRKVSITPKMAFNDAALDKQLARIARAVNVPARNARGKIGADGLVEVVAPEQKGVRLDIAATKAAILKGGAGALRNGAEAALVVQEEQPRVTAQALNEIQHPLIAVDPAWPSTRNHLFSTYYGSSSSNRRHNIELAASHINGTILGPGETFSYNKIVGPREPRLGFLDAPTYQDGQVVPGPGGGVCQVSTTLYNAVLRTAGLKVVQRSHHSMPVHYVPAGCDATVAYGDIDFQFRNDTSGPVLVAGKADGDKLAFGFYGTSPNAAQKIQVIAGERRYHPSGTFSVTTLRRVVDADGTTHTEVLGSDTYQPFNGGSGSSPSARHAKAKKRPAHRPATGAAAKPAKKPAAPAINPMPAASSPVLPA